MPRYVIKVKVRSRSFGTYDYNWWTICWSWSGGCRSESRKELSFRSAVELHIWTGSFTPPTRPLPSVYHQLCIMYIKETSGVQSQAQSWMMQVITVSFQWLNLDDINTLVLEGDGGGGGGGPAAGATGPPGGQFLRSFLRCAVVQTQSHVSNTMQ